MNDVVYLHCLNSFPKFGPKRLTLLSNYFPAFQEAFYASQLELEAAGVDSETAAAFVRMRHTLQPEQERDKLATAHINLLDFQSAAYPKLLLEISGPPPILYYRGTLPPQDTLMLACVGTRKITTYGLSVTPTLLGPLIHANLLLVSGLAYGVDAEVARTAIRLQKPSVAVLGSGVDESSLYPKAHALLAQEILETGGCILSEYPPGTPGFKQNFIARNRIISGLSVGTLLIECDLKSGSLITAEYALEQNRRLYAVPGPIYAAQSRGPNNLIKMGAQAVTDAGDILQDLHIAQPVPDAIAQGDTALETKILAILKAEPITADELVTLADADTAAVITTLTFLEIKGRIKNLGANQYIRIR